ncbi:hemerythrin domain-containing protein [Antribacter gilvus]|uniref:hemerythrin domain-containing protein n=1 Tax=Antribacter gilvus TaxID=2304675 RepID=UPI000F77E4EA|nr:hemerythrin domain-containing protein [Antribacter gilvus]
MDERVVAWGQELTAVHERLRDALEVARAAVLDGGVTPEAARELRLFCRGFCAALTGHHRSEDRNLFEVVLAERPDLGPVVSALKQDHNVLDHLLGDLDRAITSGLPADDLLRHLDGIDAIMETHFRYEEKMLVRVLDATAREDLDRTELFGPLG